jgi:hypothetical protein
VPLRWALILQHRFFAMQHKCSAFLAQRRDIGKT